MAAGDVSQSLSILLPATGGAVATVLGAWALLIRARSDSAKPLTVLRRLWDWLQDKHLDTEIPDGLRADVLAELREDEAER